MARGERSERNGARIVDIRQWVMRNHPTAAGGGAGKKPPKNPRTASGGMQEGPMDRFIGRFFPESAGYRVEDQPEYKGQQGRISDLNPRNNPLLYKFDDVPKKKKDK